LKDSQIVIANCNKPRSLVESKYNERRAETELALSLLQQKAKISCLADLTPKQFDEIGSVLPETVKKRASHVVGECERVRLAVEAMKCGDEKRLGELLNASHASLRDLYEVTGRELDALVEAAQSHPACLGSRMTGAGFGGCTVSLVKKEGVESFKQYVAERYEQATGYRAAFYDTELSDGITVQKL
jgi:galactokinase